MPDSLPDPQIRAAFYVSPSLDQWWRWSDDGEVLTWDDGQTIAFVSELEGILQALEPQGLPSFGALTLLLAACREGWRDGAMRRATIDRVQRVEGFAVGSIQGGPDLAAVTSAASVVASHTWDLVEGLDRVAALPRELRATPRAKAALADLVFEGDARRGSTGDAALIIQGLSERLSLQSLRPRIDIQEHTADFLRQVSGLITGLKRVDADTVRRRLLTGLGESPRATQHDVSPAEQARCLLAALRSDPALGALARLALDLLAAVSVPRSLSGRDSLELAGVSDLSNRGSPDRLLLSELAQDDLTLAVRLALNEALYLRRERPPEQPPERRVILLDAGIRTWGVPRVYITAVAMALAGATSPRGNLSIYRAAGERVIPTDLLSTKGVTAHLQALEPDLHPGAALRSFARAVDQAGVDGESRCDVFVLTEAESAADTAFLTELHAAGFTDVYLGVVDREGGFRLAVRSRAGERLIRQVRLSMDGILGRSVTAKRVAPPVIREGYRIRDTPAIFRAQPFPFLLNLGVKRLAWAYEHGLVGITTDNQVVQWADGEHGARQLLAMVTGSVLHFSVESGTDRLILLTVSTGNQTQSTLTTIALKTAEIAKIDLEVRRSDVKDSFVLQGALFIVGSSTTDAYDCDSGRHVAGLRHAPGVRHDRGRFYRHYSKRLAISFDGSSSLKLELCPHVPSVSALFDRPGHDGYCQFIAPSTVIHSDGRTRIHLGAHGGQFLEVSPDGERLLLESPDGEERVICHLPSLSCDSRKQNQFDAWRFRFGTRSDWTKSRFSIYRKLASIGVTPDGDLAISSRQRNKREKFAVVGQRLVLESTPDGPGEPFVRRPVQLGQRITLSCAQWPDGSRAWIDSRGVLHLQSSDVAIPEMSFVLCRTESWRDSHVAAWSTDGAVCGPKHLVGDVLQTEPDYFLKQIRAFARGLG